MTGKMYDGVCAVCGRPLVKRFCVYVPYGKQGGRSYLCRKCFPSGIVSKLWSEEELLEKIPTAEFWDIRIQLKRAKALILMAEKEDLRELQELSDAVFEVWQMAASKINELKRNKEKEEEENER